MIRFLVLLCLCGSCPILSAAVPPRPAKLGQCVACHGEDGRSRIPGTPHLGGQDQAYLVTALNAYRRGDRQAQPMNSLANTLQPADIAALARWYAQRPAVVGTRAAR
jgi:cytochrome c553